jgi:hypothetical protein
MRQASAPCCERMSTARSHVRQLQYFHYHIARLAGEAGCSIVQRTVAVVLMMSFAGLTLLLCGLGPYGVMSCATQQRTRRRCVGVARPCS